MRKIVLASASPRRKELLENIGLACQIDPSGYEEYFDPGLEPHKIARKIALAKAKVVATRHTNAIIIAADTFIVLDNQIMGKPHTENDARKMLAAISGKVHSIITGFSIVDTSNNKVFSNSIETKVQIKKLTSAEIAAYIQTREPLDKAGAYAIQGLGTAFVEKIEGDYYNVVGLPLASLTEALKEFGINALP